MIVKVTLEYQLQRKEGESHKGKKSGGKRSRKDDRGKEVTGNENEETR